MNDILLVDDDPSVVDLVVDVLEDEGYPVRIANNGREALSALADQPPLLMLLDLLMPEVDGYEVLRALHNRNSHALPVVVFTANRIDETELKKLGAAGILRKPFLLDELLTTVARYLPH